MSGMDAWFALLGSINPLAPGEGMGKAGGLLLRDVLLILGSALVLMTALLFWARIYVRRSRKSKKVHRRHRHHRASTTDASESSPPTNAEASEIGTPEASGKSSDHSSQRRRHRRRRRDHRARNPSLAQVGGLPPQRSEPSPPSVP
jgi:hypothetical protein